MNTELSLTESEIQSIIRGMDIGRSKPGLKHKQPASSNCEEGHWSQILPITSIAERRAHFEAMNHYKQRFGNR